jgi:hypothetical protein
VQQASRFEMVLNLKTAKAIGLDVPTEILALATATPTRSPAKCSFL